MGTHFTTLPPLLAAAAIALSAPSDAQEDAAPLPSLPRPQSQPQPSDPTRQGPELDVFRDVPGNAPAPVAPPLVTTTTPPPVVTPTTTPPIERQATEARNPQADRVPAQAKRTEQARPDVSQPSPAPVETPQPSGETVPTPQTDNAPPAPPATVAPQAAGDDALPWGWIGAAIALILAAGVAILLRRRSRSESATSDNDAVLKVAAPETPSPHPATPVPTTVSRRPTPPVQPVTERAWIDIDLSIDNARYSLVGVSIGYRLTLRNRGRSAASDLLVHALIGNADAHQNELLRAFFAGTKGMPVHSVVSIAPGETHVLTNELRLEPNAIEPLELDGRLLLVPLIGFDVHYRWDADGSPGSGRSGSAFVVGQEQVPPTQKLAPFRFDLGPRQYRDVGSRRTALSLAR